MAQRRFRTLRWGWRLLLLALLAAGWTLAAAAVHVVVVPEDFSSAEGSFKVLLVPKNRLSFKNTYVDTRTWTIAEARAHETLLSRLVEAGRAQYLAHILSPEQRRRLEEMLRVRRGVVAEQ